MYIDSHAHLDIVLHSQDSQNKKDNPHIFSDLLSKKLDYILHISLQPSEFLQNYPLFSINKKVLFASGIYPSYAHLPFAEKQQSLQQLKSILTSYPHIALGEAGIDCKNMHYGTLKEQQHLFAQQVELAEELDLPIIIHSRESFKECWDIVKTSNVHAIVHCFSYSLNEAEQIILRGDLISFAGNLTYKNATQLHDVARTIPLNQIILETDSPYLTPIPMRGKQNIPAYISYTYQFLSQLRNIDLESLSTQIKKNFLSFFRIS